MPGESLPTRATENVQREYWVDPAGSDATTEANARDNSSNPWATIQKACNTFVWPASGDVRINVRNGTYQAADNTRRTVDITPSFYGPGAPSSSRRLIVQNQSGHSPLVRSSAGTGAPNERTAIYLGDPYTTVRGFEITSPGQFGPLDTDAGGIWIDDANCEVDLCHIHDIKASNDSTNSKAQGIYISGASAQIWNTKIHNIGVAGQAIVQQEHGVYWSSGSHGWMVNCLVYDPLNGYCVQVQNANAGAVKLVHCTLAYSSIRDILAYNPRSISNIEVRNSIFYRPADGFYVFNGEGATGGTGRVIDYLISKGPVTGGGIVEFPADWTITNHDTTNEPGFVDGPNRNFNLTSGAAARGFGDDAYRPTTDVEGNTRSATDAGAYAFVAAATKAPVISPHRAHRGLRMR